MERRNKQQQNVVTVAGAVADDVGVLCLSVTVYMALFDRECNLAQCHWVFKLGLSWNIKSKMKNELLNCFISE